MTSFLRALPAAAALALALPVTGQAADVAVPESASGWTFTGAAYVWASSLEGEAGLFGLPEQEIDLSFGDILQDLDFSFMGLGEARNGGFVMGMDLTYTRIGSNVENPRPGENKLINDVDIDVTAWMATGYAGYNLLETDMLRMDLIGGARLWSVNTELTANSNWNAIDGRSAEDGATWVDPLAGAKMRLDLTDDVYMSAWGMVGGFGVSSDLMWDVMAGVGYEFNDTFSAFGGYRAVGVDYSNDGFVYDMVQQGPVVAAVFRF